MAETADPTEGTSSSITDPVPAQSENPNPSPEPPANPNPHPEPPTNPNPHPEPPTNPNPNPPPIAIAPPPFPPSFRPLGPPIMPPQYGSVTVSAPPVRYLPPPHYPYGHVVSNGYMTVPPPGMPHYQGPYPTMVRPGFPPRPIPPIGVISQIPRLPMPGAPFVPPTVRPAVPAVVAIEKPQTTVYVGKIASSVENDFLLSLLRLCGPVKSWKRAQDPSNGTPKGFGFCEFEAAEGILRALRLLTKLNIDGQELVLNINKTTREYLDRYVEKKTEREKLKEIENQTLEKENESEPDVEKHEFPKTTTDETAKTPESEGEDHEYKKFGIVSDEDRGVDKDSLEKIACMIKERLQKNPLPPPPPPPIQTTVSTKSNSERPSKSRDVDSDIGISRTVEGKNEDEITSGTDSTTAKEKAETSSPNKALKNERDRERDKEKDREREKERELERAERERDRERVRREKDRESKIREVERLYNNRLKDWEAREREQEHRRLKEKEREKEKQKERRREISKDEDGSDDEDDTRKRRRRRNTLEEKRRKREREKEEDLIDRIKEEEEIAEAKKRAIEEEEKRIKEMELLNNNNHINEESENVPIQVDDHMIVEGKEMDVDFAADGDNGDVINSIEMEEEMTDTMKHNNDAPTKKLGFGLVASGKKTTVPSVFHQEDDENIEDKKMRPLVPIDYSTEELQAVQTTPHSSTQPNLLAAAEFAKRISGVSNSKEKKPEVERDRNGRSTDRGRHRDREYNDSKDKGHERSYDRERDDKPKAENKKLLDAKQLIDMIPKTKEELFSYEINWAVYDKHELHEKMRPWISKKITEFLGEEEETLVEYIVNSTKDHVQASKMLELLQSILDDEAEMFVLKMWRMLIFEIKRVETGLSAQPKP